MDTSHILRATQCLGSQAALARALCITRPTVNQWCKGERPVPVEQCPAIERATKGHVQCEELHEGPWVRIPDPEWPHPQGRPLRDYAIPKETAHA